MMKVKATQIMYFLIIKYLKHYFIIYQINKKTTRIYILLKIIYLYF